MNDERNACGLSPSARHSKGESLESTFADSPKRLATCQHCGRQIVRAHKRSPWWELYEPRIYPRGAKP